MGMRVRILKRKLLSAPMEQVWSYAVMQDAVYRLKASNDTLLGAGCAKGNCKKCVYEFCKHECHKDQVFVNPITAEGKWKELKEFAWVSTAWQD